MRIGRISAATHDRQMLSQLPADHPLANPTGKSTPIGGVVDNHDEGRIRTGLCQRVDVQRLRKAHINHRGPDPKMGQTLCGDGRGGCHWPPGKDRHLGAHSQTLCSTQGYFRPRGAR